MQKGIAKGLVSSGNKTARELSSSRRQSILYHSSNNHKLYLAYLASGAQFRMTFLQWKKKHKR